MLAIEVAEPNISLNRAIDNNLIINLIVSKMANLFKNRFFQYKSEHR